jgi:hypothetical protein
VSANGAIDCQNFIPLSCFPEPIVIKELGPNEEAWEDTEQVEMEGNKGEGELEIFQKNETVGMHSKWENKKDDSNLVLTWITFWQQ